MKIIILSLLLTGCYLDKKVTKETAIERSKYLNVVCKKVRNDDIEPTIKIVGDKIGNYCRDNAQGCYYYTTNTIFTQHNDRMLINHELLHHYCLSTKHRRVKKKYIFNASNKVR